MGERNPEMIIPLPGSLLLLGALAGIRGAQAGSAHSLAYYGLAVSQPGEGLPEFLAVGYLDDQILGRYDSETPRYRPMVQWMEQNMDQHYWNWLTQFFKSRQVWHKENLETLRQYYNQTDNRIHTLQLLSKCDLRADGSTRGFLQISYDGRDFLYYDLKTNTWVAAIPQAAISQRSLNADKPYLRWLKAFLQELCIHRLQTFLVSPRAALSSPLWIPPPPLPYLLSDRISPPQQQETRFTSPVPRAEWSLLGSLCPDPVSQSRDLPSHGSLRPPLLCPFPRQCCYPLFLRLRGGWVS